MRGSIPSELGKMKQIKDLRLNKNSLTGTIPEELFALTSLKFLDLSKLSLTGILSPLVANLEDLISLKVNNNELSGEIPSSIGGMNLDSLLLYGNQFIGEVPESICDMKGPEGLMELAVDCLPSFVNDTVRVSCDCCDICCDYESGFCQDMLN